MKTAEKPVNGKATAAEVKAATVIDLKPIEKVQPIVDLSAKLQRIAEASQLTKWHSRMSNELAVLRTNVSETEPSEKLNIAIGTGDYRSNWKTDHPKLVKEVLTFIIMKYEEKILELEKEIITATV